MVVTHAVPRHGDSMHHLFLPAMQAAAEQELVDARKEVVLWRNKARHRHRHLQIPDFEKIYGAKSRAAKKDEWLKCVHISVLLPRGPLP
jgi:hypothetical protein|eukprot:COSAG01_NODE_27136_length_693_cov_1.215488_2_plen_89_part_00